MKKLMIAAAIVCAAAFANAASAVWATGFITDVDGTDLLGPSSTGYTATFNVYSDAAMTDLIATYTSDAWEDGATMGATDDILNNSTETTYYGQVIVGYNGQEMKSDGFQFTTSSLTDQIDVFVTNDAGSVAGIEKIGGGTFDGTSGAFETGGGSWESVPEPTSGLLLLLGVAGLALRRKQA